jgi:uncharacterized membrane protein SirB2
VPNLFSIGLFIHIIGITCIAGGSIGGLVLEMHLWKIIRQAPQQASAVGPLMSKYPVIIQAGTLLMLISGLMMLGALGWQVAGRAWFIVKMFLVLALILNGRFVAKPNGEKMHRLIPRLIRQRAVPVESGAGELLPENLLVESKTEMESAVKAELEAVRKRMIAFHISEMTLLGIVYLLAIFRF